MEYHQEYYFKDSVVIDLRIFTAYFVVAGLGAAFGSLMLLSPESCFRLMDWWFITIGGGSTAWLRRCPRSQIRITGLLIVLLCVWMIVLPIYSIWQHESGQTPEPPQAHQFQVRSIAFAVGLFFLFGASLYTLIRPARAVRFFTRNTLSVVPSHVETTVIRLIASVMILLSGYGLVRAFRP